MFCWLDGSVVNKEKHLDQLKLALAWNRIDFAKEILMADGVSWRVCFSQLISLRVFSIQ